MTTKQPQEHASDETEVSTDDVYFVRCWKVEECTGFKKGAIYEKCRSGLLTPPVKIGKRASAWPLAEIRAVNRAIVRGASEDEIRALVAHLVAQRRQDRGDE